MGIKNSMKKITRKHLEIFLARHASDKKTLDIGAGGSSYQRFFPNRVTIDVDAKRKPDIIADAHKLPFKDGEFPVVLCTEVLEHLRDPRIAITEMKRVLQPKGMLILTTRFVYPIHDAPHDYWRFTKYGLEELFSDWDIIELIPETTDMETMAVLLQRIGFQTHMRFNKLSKIAIFSLAFITPMSGWFLKEKYGDIKKTKKEEHILASGYYLVATPKQHV